MTRTPPDPDLSGSADSSSSAQRGTAAEGAGAPAPEGSGRAETSEISSDPVRLLVSAVGQLPAEQRDLVLTWLLRQRPSLARQWTLGAGSESRMAAAELQALQRAVAGQPLRGMPPAAQQVVPVRFPTQQHAQLREWCAEHGFSMATVIRGLVARFLEGQLPEQN
jgi:hypothetical protein